MIYLYFIKYILTAAGLVSFTGLYFHIHHNSANGPTGIVADDVNQLHHEEHILDSNDQGTTTSLQNKLHWENSENTSIELPSELKLILEEKYPRFIFCEICKNLVALINKQINLNYTFNKFRGPAESICHKVTHMIGLNKAICPGIISAYGPPVLYIADQLLLDPIPLCQKLSFCLPKYFQESDDILLHIKDEQRSTSQYDLIHNTSTTATKPKKPIRILQISDIHVDKLYKAVRK
ncbi:hypothetical protein LOTGIDRAFT_235037 [Lottia gigantea]|uniref:Saposin B-type domain-containing protein n=1 Tax=Lottia gigantea TaxID=225164 RepID=V3ZY58_LOTGI|nr:hypothetical protein LOTGIDRAFT_235037 [Lottia gigantea]ESO87575.1 hypothetical protein LOTGIDRAFT_235037 [Lottia gigantea]